MGDYYEHISLAGNHYIEYCNNDTNWTAVAIAINAEQLQALEAFEEKQAEERKYFLRGLVAKAGGGV